MIYLDTSVALAQLLAEDRTPPPGLWDESIISSRLLEYELWNRINARGLEKSHGEAVRDLLGRVALVELVQPVLARALEPFSTPVRTLDALHLASAIFVFEREPRLRVATYDAHLLAAAIALRLPLCQL